MSDYHRYAALINAIIMALNKKAPNTDVFARNQGLL